MTRIYFRLLAAMVGLWILSGLTCGCAPVAPPRMDRGPRCCGLAGAIEPRDAGAADVASDAAADEADARDTADDSCFALSCSVVDGKLACEAISCAEAAELQAQQDTAELKRLGLRRF